MHRAQQIIEAAAEAIAAQADVAAAVFVDRELSLSEDAQELPAITVLDGADVPVDDTGASNVAFIDSLLELRVMAYSKATDEVEIRRELARLRSVVHRALLGTDRTLGLTFVMDTRYGGAERPAFAAQPRGGVQEFGFRVLYRMDIATPE